MLAVGTCFFVEDVFVLNGFPFLFAGGDGVLPNRVRLRGARGGDELLGVGQDNWGETLLVVYHLFNGKQSAAAVDAIRTYE